MIMLDITQTAKGYSPADQYYQYHKFTRYFPDLDTAKEWLADEYACKRVKMYMGEGDHMGYIYCFNSPACGHDLDATRNQDWVSFYQYEPVILTMEV